MKRSLISSIFFLVAISVFAQEKKADWVKVTDSAGWRPRDSQGEVVYKNQLWILGGWLILMKLLREMYGVHPMVRIGNL